MHIISQKRIFEAQQKFPQVANALNSWYRIMKKNHFFNFTELKKTFGSIDKVGNLYIFDIGGNKLRLLANIHFNRQKIYVRYILTHKEYDNNHWKILGLAS